MNEKELLKRYVKDSSVFSLRSLESAEESQKYSFKSSHLCCRPK